MFRCNISTNVVARIAGITVECAIAPMVLDGPMDTASFEAYVEQLLVPQLPPEAVIVMDNLAAHKGPNVARLLDAAGAQLCYLPPVQLRPQPDRTHVVQAQKPIFAAPKPAPRRTST